MEAFVYCVLGSQINVESSILGPGGCAKEVKNWLTIDKNCFEGINTLFILIDCTAFGFIIWS